MPATRVTLCICGAPLTRDEHAHYVYQCTTCVMREHDVVLAHGRGEDHPDAESLFTGPVEIAGLAPLRRARAAAKPRRR